MTSITATTSDGHVSENTPGETLGYDIGAGTVVEQVEQTNYYTVDFVLNDGTTGTAQMWATQTISGEVFLLMDNGVDNGPMQTHGVDSFTITGLLNTDQGIAPNFHTSASPVCFSPGTRILTPQGYRPIESLRCGDVVSTLDHGAAPIRWVGRLPRTRITKMARVSAGVLGNTRAVLVSCQHRFLLPVPRTQDWVLCPARGLLALPGVTEAPRQDQTLFHILCDRHELIWAEGAVTETALLRPATVAMLPPGISTIVHQARRTAGLPQIMSPARPIFTRAETHRLVSDPHFNSELFRSAAYV